MYLLPSASLTPAAARGGLVGLVIERAVEGRPAIRFYDFDLRRCRALLPAALGKDLVPIIAEFNASEEKATRR